MELPEVLIQLQTSYLNSRRTVLLRGETPEGEH